MDGLNGLTGGAAAVASSAELAGLAGGGGHGGSGPHGSHGSTGACLNCGTALAPDARFCSQCGQDTANHPPSLLEFVHEFVSHYIAVEGTLWKSLWGLMARPGFLTKEYLAGRKQRYVLPLRLILTLGLLFFLALKFVPGATDTVGLDTGHDEATEQTANDGAASAVSGAASAVAAAASGSRAAQKLDKAARRVAEKSGDVTLLDKSIAQHLPDGMQARIQRAEDHWREDPKGSAKAMGATMLGLAPYAVLCSLPFFAGLLKLLFWRQPYGAHFVFAMHLHAAWYGMLLLAVLLPWGGVIFAAWLWSNIYPVVALKRVHAASWWTTLLRAGLLAALHWVLIGLGLLVLVLVGALATA
ncbi:DUF3667 domain-containing protein [Pelomonas baiyunensis]|uniref:DUF3667 domain-containing protein n=1 Tax=Pelomonas baiyunensis TaxID=3299026 RepID=A0ABW7GYY3_9BURK